jgi:hypothetical protein
VPGFDIPSNSQDREIASVEVKIERQNAARATVAAKLFNKGPRIEYPAPDDICAPTSSARTATGRSTTCARPSTARNGRSAACWPRG